MKLFKNITSGLAAIALTATVSHALPSISGNSSYSPGDLVLTFASASATSDVDFDIGSLSSFQSAYQAAQTADSPITYTVSAFDSAGVSDVTGNVGAFGANTKWFVQGSNSVSGNEFTLTSTSALNNSAGYNGVAGEVDGNGYGTAFGTGNSADDVIDGAKNFSGDIVSYTTGGYQDGPTHGVISGSAGTTVLALYDVNKSNATSGAAIELGYFTLNTTTDALTFTAIPEPSTYAAVLGALTVGFVLVRRRFGSSSLNAA